MINPYRKEVTKPAYKITNESLRRKLDKKGSIIDDAGRINPRTGVKGERFFDKKGELNAWDKKDALTMIMRLLSDENVGKVKKASYRVDSELPPEVIRDIYLQAFQSPEKFKKLGEELLAPIKNVLDYEGWARKILKVRPIGQGEIHRIPKDIWVTAFVIGQDGQAIPSQANASFVFPPEFKVTAFPEVDIGDILRMNFDVIARQQDLAKQMILLKEDKYLVNALTQFAQLINDVVYFTEFNIGTFEDIRLQVERHRLIADKFIMNRYELTSIIKNMHNYVDPVTERELILMGYIGSVYGCQIITSAGTGVQEVVPPHQVFVVTEGSFLGEMGIRAELYSEEYSKAVVSETKKGWMFVEIITQGLVNPRAVAMGRRI